MPALFYWQGRMKERESPLYSELQPLLSEMGYVLLEARSVQIKEGLKTYLVVHSEEGVSVDDCAQINRMLLPRLENMFDSQNLTLEVSSPGLERKLASFEEFIVFKGKDVRVLVEEGWVSGVITEADERAIVLDVSGTRQEFMRAEIMKARLLYREKG